MPKALHAYTKEENGVVVMRGIEFPDVVAGGSTEAEAMAEFYESVYVSMTDDMRQIKDEILGASEIGMDKCLGLFYKHKMFFSMVTEDIDAAAKGRVFVETEKMSKLKTRYREKLEEVEEAIRQTKCDVGKELVIGGA